MGRLHIDVCIQRRHALTMKYFLTTNFFVVFLFLSACGTSNSCLNCSQNTLPAPPDHIDWTGPSGTSVSFDADVTPVIDAAHYETWFLETADCVSRQILSDASILDIEGPVVRIVSSTFVINGQTLYGFTDFRTGQITVVTENISTFMHEVKHYLLLKMRVPNDQNASHNHPVFKTTLCE